VAVHHEGAAELLAAAGIRASTRAGAAQLSFHLYPTEEISTEPPPPSAHHCRVTGNY
jgi:hypothetical protein